MAATDRTGYKPFLGLMLLCAVLYVPGLTTLPPVDRDEARFAQATRQMAEDGDYVRIRFQDVPRHKKPAGIHWLQAAVVGAAGTTAPIWPYRIPSVLGALAAVLLTFAFGRKLFDEQTGLLGAAVLAGTLLLVVEAHQATTDAALLAAVVAAQGALGTVYVRNRREQTVGWGIPLLFWAAMGIGILLKGPILPLVSLLTVLAVFGVDRSTSCFRGLRLVPGIALAALIVTPWAIAVTLATDGAFLVDAIRSDLLPKLISGHETHGRPPGYHLLATAVTFWPASLFLVPALRRAVTLRSLPGERFCLAWIIPVWLTFELVPTKLPHYLLPLFPALALLAARLVLGSGTESLNHARRLPARAGFVLWALVSVGLGISIVALPLAIDDRFDMATLVPATAVVLLVILPVRRLIRGRLLDAALVIMVFQILVLGPTLQSVLPHTDGLWLSRSVAQALERHRPAAGEPGPDLAAAGYHEPSLVFLCGTGTKLVDAPGAAAHLRQNPRGFALIEETLNTEFRKALGGAGDSAMLLETVEGFNYSKGKRMTLFLYGHGRS